MENLVMGVIFIVFGLIIIFKYRDIAELVGMDKKWLKNKKEAMNNSVMNLVLPFLFGGIQLWIFDKMMDYFFLIWGIFFVCIGVYCFTLVS